MLYRRLRNATSRINTAFFVTKIKNLLTVCDIMELFRNHEPRPESYLESHPDIVVEKKSPDEDKSLADSKALLPTLKDFQQKHPNITSDIFLGDVHFRYH